MFHGKKNWTRPQTALWILAVYLSVWIGSAQGFSLVSILMNGSHQTFLAGKSDQVRLIFHHPGYQDEHEPSPGHSANRQAGLLDKVLTGGMGDTPAPDHEFYLAYHEQQITAATATKPIAIFQTLLPSSKSLENLFYIQPVSARSFPHHSKLSPTHLSIRATVLLI